MGRRGSFDAEDLEDLPEVRMLDESFVDGKVDSRRAILLENVVRSRHTPQNVSVLFDELFDLTVRHG